MIEDGGEDRRKRNDKRQKKRNGKDIMHLETKELIQKEMQRFVD